MAKVTIPRPSIGRTVLFQPTEAGDGVAYMAHVIDVGENQPDDGVMLAVFDLKALHSGAALPIATRDYVYYGVEKPGCWWWPERSNATMVVETDDDDEPGD